MDQKSRKHCWEPGKGTTDISLVPGLGHLVAPLVALFVVEGALDPCGFHKVPRAPLMWQDGYTADLILVRKSTLFKVLKTELKAASPWN